MLRDAGERARRWSERLRRESEDARQATEALRIVASEARAAADDARQDARRRVQAMLRNPADLRAAFVLSEILKPKYE